MNATVAPFLTDFSGSVTGKALGWPMYGLTAASAAALLLLLLLAEVPLPALLLVLLLLLLLLPHAARPKAKAKQAISTRTVLLANRCNVTPP